jgi:hypothetical protein
MTCQQFGPGGGWQGGARELGNCINERTELSSADTVLAGCGVINNKLILLETDLSIYFFPDSRVVDLDVARFLSMSAS